MLKAHILVQGLVQGVGFRWFVRMEAERIGLTGTVKNLNNGSVEIWTEGKKEEIEALVTRLQAGNGSSMIDNKSIQWLNCEHQWSDFSILL